MSRFGGVWIGVLACLVASGALTAQAPPTSDVEIRQAWVREADAGQASTAAYFVVENRSASPVTIAGVSSPIAATAEIHTTQMQHPMGPGTMQNGAMSGMMRMTQVAEVVVPAHGTVEFKPGGYHVMLFKITKALAVGGTADLAVRFSNGATKAVVAQVGSRAAVTSPSE